MKGVVISEMALECPICEATGLCPVTRNLALICHHCRGSGKIIVVQYERWWHRWRYKKFTARRPRRRIDVVRWSLPEKGLIDDHRAEISYQDFCDWRLPIISRHQ